MFSGKKIALGVMLTLAVSSAGCRTPVSPREKEWANIERARINSFMRGVEQLVEEGDMDGAMSHEIVYDGLRSDRRREVYLAFKRALFIGDLSGYRMLNLEDAVEALDWEDLTRRGEVELELEVACTQGRKWKDTFRLSKRPVLRVDLDHVEYFEDIDDLGDIDERLRVEKRWLLTDVRLRSPSEGEPIELGRTGDKEPVAEVVGGLLEVLHEEDPRAVLERLPSTNEARYREKKGGLFSGFRRLAGGARRTRPVEDDLKIFSQLDTAPPPAVEEGFPARYAGNMSVLLSYSLDLKDTEYGRESVTVDIYLSENEQKEWQLRKLRFAGGPIPE